MCILKFDSDFIVCELYFTIFKKWTEGPGNGGCPSFKELFTGSPGKHIECSFLLNLPGFRSQERWPLLQDLLAGSYFCGLRCPGEVLVRASTGSRETGKLESAGRSRWPPLCCSTDQPDPSALPNQAWRGAPGVNVRAGNSEEMAWCCQ